jgi:hypothetical protein
MTTDPKEINRLKQSRRNALLNIAGRRMGYTSWSNFGTKFSEALAALPPGATEAQVNAELETIITAAFVALAGNDTKKNTPDKELSDVFEKTPRLRTWKINKAA